MQIVLQLPVAQVRVLPNNITVIPSANWPVEYGAPPPVSLMRDPSRPGPRQSYALDSGFHPVDLEGPPHVHHWGETYRAVVYPQLRPLTFEAPHPRDAQWVVIDRLNLPVVRRYLDRDDGNAGWNLQHDPYQPHPQIIERFQDETNLYVIKTSSMVIAEF